MVEAAHSRKSRLAVPVGGDPLLHPTTTTTTASSRSATTSTATTSTKTTTTTTSMPISLSSTNNRPLQYLQRLTDVRQMDLQSALDQMKTLLGTRPQVVYKTAYYRKQTKNHWARDDPAFAFLQAVFLILASIAYAVAFRIQIAGIVSFVVASLLWNWLGMGIIVASACREIANRHLVSHQSTSHVRQYVEWLYAFDIHCNSFFPLFVVLCKCETNHSQECSSETRSHKFNHRNVLTHRA
jgi:hypothetical protein